MGQKINRRILAASVVTAVFLLSMFAALGGALKASAESKPVKLKFEVMMPEYDPVRVRAGELLAEYAGQLGIKITPKPVDLNVELSKVMDEHNFDMYILGWSGRNMPMYVGHMAISSEDRPGGNNAEGLHNATLDKLAEELDKTVDPEKQKQILWKIQEILADQVPYVGIYTRYLTQVWGAEWTDLHKEYWGYASPMTWRLAHKKGKTGGTFVVILAKDLKAENVFLEKSIYEDMVWDALYDTLVYLDDNYSPKPWLAYKYEYSDGGKVWTFHLVNNATFHDGKPITAKDVKFTFDFIKENNIPDLSTIAKYYDHAEIIDDYTIKIYLTEPYAWFLYDLADTPIIPEHVWKNTPWNTSKAPKVGSGPFKWVKRVEGEYVELEKYDNYWRSDMPKVDKLVFRIIDNFNSALLAMEAGEADFYVYYIPVSAVDRVKNNPKLHLNLEKGFTFYYLGFNLRKPPMDDVWFRRAIAYLIPKDEVVKGPLNGLGEPCTWYVSPYFGDFSNPHVPEKYTWIGSTKAQPDKAREMLAKSTKYEYKDVDGDGILEAVPKAQTTTTTTTTTRTTTTTTTTTAPPAPGTTTVTVTSTVTKTTTVSSVATTTTTVTKGMPASQVAAAIILIIIVLLIAFWMMRKK